MVFPEPGIDGNAIYMIFFYVGIKRKDNAKGKMMLILFFEGSWLLGT